MKHLLPLIISGFVLCGFFAVCLCVFLVPRSDQQPEIIEQSVTIPDPEIVYISDYSIPFSIVYPDYNSSYNYSWSFTDSFRSWSNAGNIGNASVLGNILYFTSLNPSLFNHTLYFKCDVFDGSSVVDSVIYAFRFIKFPVTASTSSVASVRSQSVEAVPELSEEVETAPNEEEPEPEPEPTQTIIEGD